MGQRAEQKCTSLFQCGAPNASNHKILQWIYQWSLCSYTHDAAIHDRSFDHSGGGGMARELPEIIIANMSASDMSTRHLEFLANMFLGHVADISNDMSETCSICLLF
jgi:hypothetical protein